MEKIREIELSLIVILKLGRDPLKYSAAGFMRPAHIHVKVSAPSLSSHTTQLYFEGDEHYDFFVRPSLILKLDEKDGTKYSEFDFVVFTP